MKASEVIEQLQQLVDEGHDVELKIESIDPETKKWNNFPIDLITWHSCTNENIIMLKYN